MNAVAALQLLIAAAFLSIPLVRSRYGARAQAAVEAELGRQGSVRRSWRRTACGSTPAGTRPGPPSGSPSP
ncbi:hypothetical protein [Streptomyces sp. 3211]|uniref:hypothetical protein n=1 Tax=Streptomyces sp. 3211 TaxID=1964449 RepID=UPI001811FE6A|nr:hypothetical protein [Streptomyces sp. 3211]